MPPPSVWLQRSEPEPGGPVSVALRMASDISEVEAAVELMADHCFAGLTPCDRTKFRLRVALAEALSNAILRGNLEDRDKRVSVKAELFPETILLEIADEGNGFDVPRTVPTTLPKSIDDECGRGLFIIRHLADRVEFNDQGNTIWMTLPRC